MKRRATSLDVTEYRKLDDWAQHVVRMFGGEVPYLVGSALDDPNHRDVDVRLIMGDDEYQWLADLVDPKRLGFLVSLWGQQATGLRIDFQIQSHTEANRQHNRGRRHAVGLVVSKP